VKEFQNIKFRIEDRVARITFARPPLNILNIAMMREISAALNQCALQRDLAAIVFDAAQGTRAFSAGVAVEEHVAETVFQMLDSFHSIFRALVQISKPVIASDRARFGQPEIKLGVFPPVAAILLPRLIGDKKAREMILLGEIIDTNEALRLGLVNQVAPSSELNQQTEAVLAKLRVLSSSSLQMTRTALELGKRGNFESALTEVENLYLHELMQTPDATEGVKAFMDKRKPEWRNK